MVSISDFWKWTEKHKDLIDFSNFEENILGAEPAWAKDKRRVDYSNSRRFKRTKWSVDEDTHLEYMLEQQKYSYSDISEALHRSESAVKRRIYDLNLMLRPIKQPKVPWTEDEINAVIRLKEKGYDFEYIGQKLKRTGSACRGCFERLGVRAND